MGKNFCNIGSKWCKFCKRGNCDFSKVAVDTLNKCPRIEAIATKTLHDMLIMTDFDTVFDTLCKFYPSQTVNIDGYRDVYNKLFTLHPHKMHNLNDLFIVVEKVVEEDGVYPDVYGKQITGHNPIRYGIEFCKWKDWLSMYITQESLDNFTPTEIVAACLYEMTFNGYDEDIIQGHMDKMIKSIEDIKKNN